jgi:hypothetical protein
VIQKKTGQPVQSEITERTTDTRLLASSIRLDFVTAAFSLPAAFVRGVRYVLASMPDWSQAGSHRLASALRGRHPFAAVHEADINLSSDRKPARGTAAAWHARLERTVQYLGIEVDDAMTITEQIDL